MTLMILLIFYEIVTCVLYNSMIRERRGVCEFRLKVCKNHLKERNQLKIDVMKLPCLPENTCFKNEKWLGYPWQIVKTQVLSKKSLTEAQDYYYFTVKHRLEPGHYYCARIIQSKYEVFTNPIYKFKIGCFYPVIVRLDKSILAMNKHTTRICKIDQDEYNKYYWRRYIPLFLSGVLVGIIVIGIMLRMVLRKKKQEPDRTWVYNEKPFQLPNRHHMNK